MSAFMTRDMELRALLKSIGPAMYGRHGWQTFLAEDLGTDSSQMRKWLGGRLIPDDVAGALPAIIRKREKELKEATARVSGYLKGAK